MHNTFFEELPQPRDILKAKFAEAIQHHLQDSGRSGDLHLGTYSFRPWNAALLLKAVLPLSPTNPLHKCWNRHATNTTGVRLASVTPSTLNPTCHSFMTAFGWVNPTCQQHAMTYSSAPRPAASRGGLAIAFIITAQ